MGINADMSANHAFMPKINKKNLLLSKIFLYLCEKKTF